VLRRHLILFLFLLFTQQIPAVYHDPDDIKQAESLHSLLTNYKTIETQLLFFRTIRMRLDLIAQSAIFFAKETPDNKILTAEINRIKNATFSPPAVPSLSASLFSDTLAFVSSRLTLLTNENNLCQTRLQELVPRSTIAPVSKYLRQLQQTVADKTPHNIALHQALSRQADLIAKLRQARANRIIFITHAVAKLKTLSASLSGKTLSCTEMTEMSKTEEDDTSLVERFNRFEFNFSTRNYSFEWTITPSAPAVPPSSPDYTYYSINGDGGKNCLRIKGNEKLPAPRPKLMRRTQADIANEEKDKANSKFNLFTFQFAADIPDNPEISGEVTLTFSSAGCIEIRFTSPGLSLFYPSINSDYPDKVQTFSPYVLIASYQFAAIGTQCYPCKWTLEEDNPFSFRLIWILPAHATKIQ